MMIFGLSTKVESKTPENMKSQIEEAEDFTNFLLGLN